MVLLAVTDPSPIHLEKNMAEKTDLRILRIIMADPAGNRTAIVRTFVPAPLRARTAAEIMQIRSLHAEQVGFETTPLAGGAGRLEMMGGEFCGNAARSYGYLLSTERADQNEEILIEISGHTGLLKVSCDPARKRSFAWMPMPQRLDYSPEGLPMVISEGITHMILENTDPDPDLIRRMVDRYGKKYEAFGMMFLREDRLVPVVYVEAAGSLVYESSCGSGSLAAAWYQDGRASRGLEPGRETLYTYKEPGGDILIRLHREEDGSLTGEMGGEILLEPERTVTL